MVTFDASEGPIIRPPIVLVIFAPIAIALAPETVLLLPIATPAVAEETALPQPIAVFATVPVTVF